MNPAYHTLIQAARLAPSGDNLQPWAFHVDDDREVITIMVDPTRDRSPMNAGQRMARIALGAAAENLCRTAAHNCWKCDLVKCNDVNAIALRVVGTDTRGTIDELILGRTTNRRRYDARRLSDEWLAQVEGLQSPSCSVRMRWFVDRASIDEIAMAIGGADALMFSQAEIFRAFLGNVRFELPSGEPAFQGLPVATLGLSMADQAALRHASKLPARFLSSGLMRRSFFAKARRLVKSASGVCMIEADDRKEATDYVVGRALQRAWLRLSELGLAVQPMMSIPVLDNYIEHARESVAALSAKFAQITNQLSSIFGTTGRTAALLRFGFAPAPPVRAGRLPVESLVIETSRCEIPAK